MKSPKQIILVIVISMLAANAAPSVRAASSSSKQVNAQEIAPALSRYRRGPSESERAAAANAEIKKQQDLAKKQQLEQLKAIKQMQLEALAANNKAVQLGKSGRLDEAIVSHEEAVQLDPSNKQYRINLSAAYCAYGQELMTKKEFGAASVYFRKSVVIASDNALAGKMLVESLKKMGINPNSADDRINLADNLMTQGDIAGAGVEYQAAEQLEQSAKTFAKLGDYAYRLGQIDTAASWYAQAILKDSDYAPAYRQLGFIAMSKQDQSQAASLLRKAVILDNKDKAAGSALVDLWRKQVSANPQSAENHLGLASSLQLTGDLSAAELEYRKVSSLDPHNPALPSATASLKRAYQHQEAERHAEAAKTFWEQNLKQDALTEMSRAVAMEPKNAQFQFALAEYLEANGDYQGAHQAYLTCVLIDPENNKEAAARMRALQNVSSSAVNNTMANQNQASQSNVINNSEQQNIQNTENAAAEEAKKAVIDKIQSLEAAHNYEQAIVMLKELASNNLENPAIHHRLAVDLMSSGEIQEAISEFRIASALAPQEKTYAADLAQALNINKQALSLDNKPSDGKH